MSAPSQADLILDYLREEGPITPMQALWNFGCLRLGARIYDLKRKGHQIVTELIDVGEGKHVARYSLIAGGDNANS